MDCIYPRKNEGNLENNAQLSIDRDTCIDCGVCSSFSLIRPLCNKVRLTTFCKDRNRFCVRDSPCRKSPVIRHSYCHILTRSAKTLTVITRPCPPVPDELTLYVFQREPSMVPYGDLRPATIRQGGQTRKAQRQPCRGLAFTLWTGERE